MNAIILMAGIGSRLGNPFPKCLTPLNDTHTILDHQLANLQGAVRDVFGVIGFKKELILEHRPDLLYVYNPRFDQTNTSKSLLCALEHIENRDVLWLNGDVVFDSRIIPELLACPDSCMAVLTNKVDEEEIKYRVDEHGYINAVSKKVANALGEAIGINLVRAHDLDCFKECLRRCDDSDYFERGLEMAIGQGMKIRPVDVTRYPCVEIDFVEDLRRAKNFLVDGKLPNG